MLGNRVYLISSTFLAGIVVLNAYMNHEEFYPTVVYIMKSKSILLVLFNFAVAMSVIGFKIVTKVFFSALKEAEVQNMESQVMHHGFNLIIVLYMLHMDFDWHIASHITANLAVYALHNLGSKRVEYLFTENYAKKAYFQMLVFHILLILLDIRLIAIESAEGYESLYILLSYEYILMTIYAGKSLSDYFLHMFEKLLKPDGWENKSMCLGFTEFLYNLTALLVLVVEFVVLSKRSSIGIYFLDKALRAIANIWKCLSGYLDSRKLLSKVNTFPDATIEEIHKANDKCIFCLDNLTTAKRINCGHLFHYKCLRSYFENSSSPKCPTCRADIDEKIVQTKTSEGLSQSIAASFLLQDLPSHVNSLGNPLVIGATAWGLPQVARSHKISKHNEKMRQAIENMNDFIVRFYKHPPDQIEEIDDPDQDLTKLKEMFLKSIDNHA